MTPLTVYGIPNCNTVKKARTWLNDHGLEYTFHDFKKSGVTRELLDAWCSAFGWEKVLNRKGTTWKKLPAAETEKVTDQASAVNLLLSHTSAIKRPVIARQGEALLLGFEEQAYAELLQQ